MFYIRFSPDPAALQSQLFDLPQLVSVQLNQFSYNCTTLTLSNFSGENAGRGFALCLRAGTTCPQPQIISAPEAKDNSEEREQIFTKV